MSRRNKSNLPPKRPEGWIKPIILGNHRILPDGQVYAARQDGSWRKMGKIPPDQVERLQKEQNDDRSLPMINPKRQIRQNPS